MSARAAIPLRHAALVWLGAWLAGGLAASALLGASGADSVAEAGANWLLAMSIAQWLPMVVALIALGRRFGVGELIADYGFSFRPIDLIGIPIGVATQLVLVPLLYLPLEAAWPETFRSEKIEERARDLWESASGVGVIAVIFVVVVGAPIVEELIYRGMLQGAFTRAMRRKLVAMVVVAAWFAIVHFQPIEYPGLMLVGLVLGLCVLRTGRLGMSVIAHAAFNATGLIVVATSS